MYLQNLADRLPYNGPTKSLFTHCTHEIYEDEMTQAISEKYVGITWPMAYLFLSVEYSVV